MYQTNATTINFADITATYEATSSIIDFPPILQAYDSENGFKFDIMELFSHVTSFLYWTAIQTAQRAGITSDTIAFIQQNRGSWLERPEYVENRIQSSLSKVIRRSCSLNMRMSQYGMKRFLTVKFNREENGYYKMSDARKLAMDIASAYEKYLGVSIMETNWLAEGSKLPQ